MGLTFLTALTATILSLDTGFEAKISDMVEVPKLISSKCTHHDSFVDCDGKTWLNPEGTLYLFNLDSNSNPLRQDRSIHHGTTYGRKLFCYDDVVYQFGGTGMFLYNAKLLYFDRSNKEWFSQPVEGLDWKRLIYFSTQFGDSLIVFSKEHPNAEVLEMGFLDLNNFNYIILNTFESFDFFEKYQTNNFTIDSEDLTFLMTSYPFGLLFDKRSLKFYRPNFSFRFPSYDYGHSYLNDEELKVLCQAPTGEIELYTFDISNFQTRFPEETFRNSGRFDLFFYLLLSSVVIIALVGTIMFRVIFNRRAALAKTNKELLKRLSIYNRQEISGSDLQNALGLNYDNPDTMRVKMNAMIKEINNQQPGTIERVRDKKDSRMVNYFINIQS